MDTPSEKTYEIARALAPEQREMFFTLGAEIQNRKTLRLGFRVDADYAHEQALLALEAVNWASCEAGEAMASLMRYF